MTGGKQDEPGFASRWSRLKQEAKEPPAEAEAAAPVDEPPVADDRPDEEVLAELDLPDPDTLKPGDDFTAFMARTVPARLRNRALRKLWISDPVLANLDELIDYGDDFTDAAAVIDNLQTSYQVGKGFADKVAELSKEDTAGAEEPEAEETPGEQLAEQSEEAEEESAEAVAEPAVDDNATDDATVESVPDRATRQVMPEPGAPLKQRMRFRVAEE